MYGVILILQDMNTCYDFPGCFLPYLPKARSKFKNSLFGMFCIQIFIGANGLNSFMLEYDSAIHLRLQIEFLLPRLPADINKEE